MNTYSTYSIKIEDDAITVTIPFNRINDMGDNVGDNIGQTCNDDLIIYKCVNELTGDITMTADADSSITAKRAIAGILGTNGGDAFVIIADCTNKGDVTSAGEYKLGQLSGIAGNTSAYIYKYVNEGKISERQCT